MDDCMQNIPSYLCHHYELLSDIPEPSLSSLDESLISCQDVDSPAKEDSHSDGEAVKAIMTSTPQRKNDQRRSVSLMDVSKIDAFSMKPFGNMLASWDTIGSQSSVGKSRDSGYVHSGSLISLNSAKLSEIKGGSDQVSTIIDECTRLKRELEYSEVLINTLQESNNELRMKCAAAHNRISEMRMKCANHCDCCFHQYSRPEPKTNVLTDPFFMASSSSSDSSSSEESDSRSPSPETVKHTCRSFQSKTNFLQISDSKVDNYLKTGEDSNPDASIETNNEIQDDLSRGVIGGKTRNIAWVDVGETPRQANPIRFSRSRYNSRNDYVVPIVSATPRQIISKSVTDLSYKQPTIEDELLIKTIGVSKSSGGKVGENRKSSLVIKSHLQPQRDSMSEEQIFKPSDFENNRRQIEVKKSTDKNDSEPESNEHSTIDNLLSEVENNAKENPKFLAREVNGKILVGSFKVWGDSSTRVTSKSDLLSKSQSSVKVPSPKLSVERIADFSRDELNLKGACVRLSGTSPDIYHVKRPWTMYSSFSKVSDLSRSHQMSQSNNSLNQDFSQHIPVEKSSYNRSSSPSVRDSVNITVSSRNDKCQLHISQGYSGGTPLKVNFSTWNDVKEGSTDSSEILTRSETSSVDSYSSAPASTSCRENLSNLGVSVSKSKICPDSVSDRWKNFKSKFERLSLSSLISGDSPDKSKCENSSGRTSLLARGSNSCLNAQPTDNEPISSASYQHDSTDVKDKSVNSAPSQSMQECLDKANEYASELSRGLARLPSRLGYIKNIGKP